MIITQATWTVSPVEQCQTMFSQILQSRAHHISKFRLEVLPHMLIEVGFLLITKPPATRTAGRPAATTASFVMSF